MRKPKTKAAMADARVDRLRRQIARLKTTLSEIGADVPQKLLHLADWHDMRDNAKGFMGSREVQEDLRKLAYTLRSILALAALHCTLDPFKRWAKPKAQPALTQP